MYLKIKGAVQGVGFRPFIYQLATELGLTGWVKNSAEGVLIEVEGNQVLLETFLLRLQQEKPPLAIIQDIQSCWGDRIGDDKFEIKTSTGGDKTALILPDIATCVKCLQEIFDPNNRRYYYPFTNCTNCGPRFSIIEALPYDRPNTMMKEFTMCDRCLAEYQNPLDRRFHAQPNACADCGCHVELWDRQGTVLSTHHKALLETVSAIREGKVLAIKGLGGFHLVVDARNDTAVQKLRDRKNRPHKPLALMYPNLELVKAHCQVSALEAKLLLSPQAPIVLLQTIIHPSKKVAPNNPYLGIMLPYTPLHHLLMKELGFPIVATSGNLSGEPICIDNQEALSRLNNIADLFLVNNRPIARPVDDSIVRVMGGREQILRRARGYAPLPITSRYPLSTNKNQSQEILAVGGQLKNTVAFLQDNQIFLSQYIGDLETVATFERFQQTVRDFQELYQLKPVQVACDLHPNYLSTQYAKKLDIPITSVQHHYAHVLSCMADNEIKDPESVLGVAWDGTGYGLDGTIWGGEFLTITNTGFKRVAHLQTFRLAGGVQAIKEPRRIAIALLYEVFGDRLFTEMEKFAHLPCIQAFTSKELNILHTIHTMLSNHINVPITSSMGRLFDGVASILGIRQAISYEGQAAMELEFAIAEMNSECPSGVADAVGISSSELKRSQFDAVYSFNLIKSPEQSINTPIVIDWKVMVKQILIDINNNIPLGAISAKFHNTLVDIVVAMAKILGKKQIVLTGGCWQNKHLTENAIAHLRQENFIPYWHRRIPCNDSGIAIGQIIATNI